MEGERPPRRAQAPQHGHRPAAVLHGPQPRLAQPQKQAGHAIQGARWLHLGGGNGGQISVRVWGHLYPSCPQKGPQTEQRPHPAPHSLPSPVTPQVHSTHQALEPSHVGVQAVDPLLQPCLHLGPESSHPGLRTQRDRLAPRECSGQKAFDASSRAADPRATLRAVCLHFPWLRWTLGAWACGLGWGSGGGGRNGHSSPAPSHLTSKWPSRVPWQPRAVKRRYLYSNS